MSHLLPVVTMSQFFSNNDFASFFQKRFKKLALKEISFLNELLLKENCCVGLMSCLVEIGIVKNPLRQKKEQNQLQNEKSPKEKKNETKKLFYLKTYQVSDSKANI